MLNENGNSYFPQLSVNTKLDYVTQKYQYSYEKTQAHGGSVLLWKFKQNYIENQW